jgi:uncharacterized DUF497 family protein
MKYHQIVSLIRDVSESVNPTGTFIHGRNSDAATAADRPYPRIVLYPFDTNQQGKDLERKTSNLLLTFVEPDSGENITEERETIIGRMDELVTEWLANLTDRNAVELVSVRREQLIYVLEGVTGYSLALTIAHQDEC